MQERERAHEFPGLTPPVPTTKAKDRGGQDRMFVFINAKKKIVFVYRREMSRVRLPAIVQLRMQYQQRSLEEEEEDSDRDK